MRDTKLTIRVDDVEGRGLELAARSKRLALGTWARRVLVEAAIAAGTYPLLDAYRDPADPTLIWVWCGRCGRWHTHSGEPQGPRSAHCPPGEGFWPGTYTLLDRGILTARERARREGDGR